MQHLEKNRLKSIGFVQNIIHFVSLVQGIFDDFVQFHILSLQILYFQFRRNDDFVGLEHLNHIGGDTKEGTKWLLESIETAFQAFDHVDTIDTSQRLADVFRILISIAIFGFQELHGSVSGIVEMFGMFLVRQRSQSFIKTGTGISIHLIDQFARREDIRKDNALRSDVCPIVFIIQDIVSSSTHRYLIDNLTTNLFVDAIHFIGHISLVTLPHQLIVIQYQRRKESLQVRNTVNGTILAILEQKQQILQVIGTVIQRGSRKQHDFFLHTSQ